MPWDTNEDPFASARLAVYRFGSLSHIGSAWPLLFRFGPLDHIFSLFRYARACHDIMPCMNACYEYVYRYSRFAYYRIYMLGTQSQYEYHRSNAHLHYYATSKSATTHINMILEITYTHYKLNSANCTSSLKRISSHTYKSWMQVGRSLNIAYTHSKHHSASYSSTHIDI
mgnify:CR=1 FL=1